MQVHQWLEWIKGLVHGPSHGTQRNDPEVGIVEREEVMAGESIGNTNASCQEAHLQNRDDVRSGVPVGVRDSQTGPAASIIRGYAQKPRGKK